MSFINRNASLTGTVETDVVINAHADLGHAYDIKSISLFRTLSGASVAETNVVLKVKDPCDLERARIVIPLEAGTLTYDSRIILPANNWKLTAQTSANGVLIDANIFKFFNGGHLYCDYLATSDCSGNWDIDVTDQFVGYPEDYASISGTLNRWGYWVDPNTNNGYLTGWFDVANYDPTKDLTPLSALAPVPSSSYVTTYNLCNRVSCDTPGSYHQFTIDMSHLRNINNNVIPAGTTYDHNTPYEYVIPCDGLYNLRYVSGAFSPGYWTGSWTDATHYEPDNYFSDQYYSNPDYWLTYQKMFGSTSTIGTWWGDIGPSQGHSQYYASTMTYMIYHASSQTYTAGSFEGGSRPPYSLNEFQAAMVGNEDIFINLQLYAGDKIYFWWYTRTNDFYNPNDANSQGWDSSWTYWKFLRTTTYNVPYGTRWPFTTTGSTIFKIIKQ